MSNTIEAKVIDGEMWVRAADHQRVLDRANRVAYLAHEAGRAAAAVAEREACAKVADGYVGADPIAAAIRARGQQ